MNSYRERHRQAPILWLFIVLLALPPGLMPKAGATVPASINPMAHDVLMETFRNPAVTSGQYNRFLMTQSPKELLGDGGEDLQYPDERGNFLDAEPNAICSGRLEWAEEDMHLPGLSFDLAFSRIHRGSVGSVTPYNGPLGNNWDFNWNKHFDLSGGNLTLYDMGRYDIYAGSGGSYTSPAGRYDTATVASGQVTRTDKYGIVELYDRVTYAPPHDWYHLTKMIDLHENEIRFNYGFEDGVERLTRVTNDAGFRASLYYNDEGYITTIEDLDGRQWRYLYDSDNSLTEVQPPEYDGIGTSHDYDGADRATKYFYDDLDLVGVQLPESTPNYTWAWTYSSGVVLSQYRDAESDGMGGFTGGLITPITYDPTNKRVTVGDRVDPTNLRTVYEYGPSFNVTKRKIYVATSTSYDTTWAYDAHNEVTEVVFPRGNRIDYTYDSKGNILTVDHKKDGSDTTPIRWTYGYGAYSRLTSLTDPNGHAWTYEYNSTGDLTKKTAPAVTMPSTPDNISTTNKNSALNSTYDGTIIETWEYDQWGNATRWTDAMGTIRNAEYEVIDVDGHPLNLTQLVEDPGAGHLAITHNWYYDQFSHPTAYKNTEQTQTYYDYNSLDELIESREPGNVTRTYIHDYRGNVISTQESNDTAEGDSLYVTTTEFDRLDNSTRLITDLDASRRLTTEYAYDANERLTRLTEPGSQITEWSYDHRGLRTAITWKAVSSADDQIFTITYDGNGNQTTLTDPRNTGYRTLLAYDGYDRLTKTTQPEGNYWTAAYDAAGNVTDVSWYNIGNSKLAEMTYAYDEANRHYQTETLAKKADLSTDIGDGWQTRTFYRDENGNVLQVQGEACGCARNTFVYDAMNQQITILDNMPTSPSNQQNYTVKSYDSSGYVIGTTRHDMTQNSGIEGSKIVITLYQYDLRHRLTKQRDKLDASAFGDTIYAFGKRDQVTSVTDAEGRVQAFEQNEALWPTAEITEIAGSGSANDVITEHLYDISDRTITYRATNGANESTIYTYDPFWRLVSTTWPDGNDSLYAYDKASNIISFVDPIGTVRVSSYDKNNRLTLQNISRATNVVGATQLTFDYDDMDRVTEADSYESTSFSSKVGWVYNTFSKIQTENQVIDGYASGAGRTITHDWNIDGKRTAVTYPTSGDVISYERDALDRVDVISRGTTRVVDYTFSGDRVLRKTFPGSRGTYSYDAFGHVTDILHEDSGGQDLAEFQLGYDKSHQAVRMDKLYYDDIQSTRITTDGMDRGEQYAYDEAQRLVTCLRGVPSNKVATAIATNAADSSAYSEKVLYEYDQAGNRTTRRVNGSVDKAYEYDAANQMTKEGGATLAYTANGNYSGASGSIKYDHADRLGSSTGTISYAYHYDALGRLVQRDHLSALMKVRFYYDGLHVVEQNRYTNTEVARKLFVFGETIDELLEYVDVAAMPDKFFYVHADRLGSMQVLVDASGNIKESYRYKEFGETTNVDGAFAKVTTSVDSPIGNPYRYTGRRSDVQIGSYNDDWYDYRARVMRPSVGRFMQRDPLAYVDGSNLYTYVEGNPIGLIDPLGTQDGSVAGAVPVPPSGLEGLGSTIASGLCAAADWAAGALGAVATAGVSVMPPISITDIQKLLKERNKAEKAKKVSKGKKEAAERKAKKRAKWLEKGVRPGNIGPSGEPKRHNKDYNNRKAAKEGARREGKGAPASDKNHFHPTTDDCGTKPDGAPHHSYP